MTMEQIEFGSDLDKKLAAGHILGGNIQTFLLIHPLLTLKRQLGSNLLLKGCADIWIGGNQNWNIACLSVQCCLEID